MTVIGYHASHESIAPDALLEYVIAAEQAGFEAAMCSDHFHPWTAEQGQSGYAWSWLGAALQATRLSFGTVTAPGQRYHPAIVAQSAATLEVMFPGRFWLALGSGEALNEAITGQRWPSKDERNARLRECADVIRALWRGETVTHRGLVTVENAKLYTRPERPPLLIGPALSAETARFLAGWADGLITIAQEPDSLREIVDAWRAGGGEGKPMYLQAFVSWAPNGDDALRFASPWRVTLLGSDALAELRQPEHFDSAAAHIDASDVESDMRISSDLDRHVEWLRGDIELGFERIYLHNSGPNQREFIDAFAERVLPHLR